MFPVPHTLLCAFTDLHVQPTNLQFLFCNLVRLFHMLFWNLSFLMDRLLIPTPTVTCTPSLSHLSLSIIIWHICRQHRHLCFSSNLWSLQVFRQMFLSPPFAASPAFLGSEFVSQHLKATKTRHFIVYEMPREVGREDSYCWQFGVPVPRSQHQDLWEKSMNAVGARAPCSKAVGPLT